MSTDRATTPVGYGQLTLPNLQRGGVNLEAASEGLQKENVFLFRDLAG